MHQYFGSEKCQVVATRAAPRHIIKVTMSVVCYKKGFKSKKRSGLWEVVGGAWDRGERLPAMLVPVERLARKGLLFEVGVMAVVAGDEGK